MTAELSKDFAPIVEPVAIMDAENFLGLVARQPALDHADAQRATEAVLATLAEWIAPGEVDDLLTRQPVELHPPLKEGRATGDARSRKMPADAFVGRVAQREGVEAATAMAHIRAVFTALRTAVGFEEFFDITAELPEQYGTLVGLV